MQFDQKTIMVGISLLGTIGSMTMGGNQFSGMNKAREQYSRQREVLSDVENSETIRLAQDKIAIARYSSCELLARGSSESGFTFPSIDKNTEVVDRHTGVGLPKNSVICDAYGNTALLGDDGKPDAKTIAFTGSRATIAVRIKRYRGGVYSQPVAK
ncbi:MAG: hypothetical protein KME60_03490 [Cyanomargarita calcarea GSE-NOS-MK-12-04C]|jgi:hypothetical protein|uniref:Uncharacterized protein n=1 Tax=Cyanomargarita calcarea GSE-NOS-MK-12-04C TaxID=2839659 RepID=A0A951QL62_9CYAN|nr:hypothetical protein [Cyanomargarita calcarea GSE-NOS-MK-12-04C]